MRKAFRWAGILLLWLLTVIVVGFMVFNESEPEGIASEEADLVASQMLEALNDSAWQSTRYVQWTFKGLNNYLWDKEENWVRVKSRNGQVVILDASTISGMVYQENGQQVLGEGAEEAIQSAWKSFCNDGFWLYAPFKVFDDGTQRSLVRLDDGSEGLKVTYTTGGVTPGDTYVWILDENYRPKAWKLWVKIIPVGGAEFSWDGWIQLPTGAWVSTLHRSRLVDLEMTDVKAGNSLAELGIEENPFEN